MTWHGPYLFLIFLFSSIKEKLQINRAACTVVCKIKQGYWYLLQCFSSYIFLSPIYFTYLWLNPDWSFCVYILWPPSKLIVKLPSALVKLKFRAACLHVILTHKSEFFIHINCGILFLISIYVLLKSILSSQYNLCNTLVYYANLKFIRFGPWN